MRKEDTCDCGKGRISAYDYKCGHCRTKEQIAFVRKLTDKAHQAPGLILIVASIPNRTLGELEYQQVRYSIDDLVRIEKAVLNGKKVRLYHSSREEASAAHQVRDFIVDLVQKVILAGNQPKLY